jgi:hypothetical protein
VVIIDTDVLLLAFAFQRDPRQADNAAFLAQAQNANPAITVYNLMELLGQLSFNLSPSRLVEWESWLIETHHLTVIWLRAAENQNADAFFALRYLSVRLSKCARIAWHLWIHLFWV